MSLCTPTKNTAGRCLENSRWASEWEWDSIRRPPPPLTRLVRTFSGLHLSFSRKMSGPEFMSKKTANVEPLMAARGKPLFTKNRSCRGQLCLSGLRDSYKISVLKYLVLPLNNTGSAAAVKSSWMDPDTQTPEPPSPCSTPRRLFLSFTAPHSPNCLGSGSQPPPLDTNPYRLIDNENTWRQNRRL